MVQIIRASCCSHYRGIRAGIDRVGWVKNTVGATYLPTTHYALLSLRIIAHSLPAEALQVGVGVWYAFIGARVDVRLPEAGSWEWREVVMVAVL